MLAAIDAALAELLHAQHKKPRAPERVQLFYEKTGKEPFTRIDYMRHFKEISPATASRDIKEARNNGLLTKSGDKRTSKYRFIK